MEVRTLAYLSGDPEMINSYETGEDLYVKAAKMFQPDMDYNDKEVLGYQRGIFKTLLLGKLYRMSDNALAVQLRLKQDDVVGASKALFKLFHVVKSYGDASSQYPLTNNRKVDTVLGDIITLSTKEPDYRLLVQGINLKIQGFTATALASGFYNIIREGDRCSIKVQPNIVVHDSSTNIFKIRDVLEIGEFYYKHFTEWLYAKYGVKWLFKTYIGVNYYDVCELSNIDESTLKLSGSNRSINFIFDRLKLNNMNFDLLTPEYTGIESLYPNKFSEFIALEGKASFDKDNSYSTVKIKIHK